MKTFFEVRTWENRENMKLLRKMSRKRMARRRRWKNKSNKRSEKVLFRMALKRDSIIKGRKTSLKILKAAKEIAVTAINRLRKTWISTTLKMLRSSMLIESKRLTSCNRRALMR